eukprot:CAMPEP_0202695470 /NCGR_PEP_ID=MMETSP1385-20130828/9049_1 /ASSEMBLY_ACC=CAM_ASM_000861 /TAXON_ID=933848 /ORGANISM="Elphidium margaritaceum" /LENGTH=737 /DNA_ID=CAMNT_0049351501 /DNA_START=17 /DNA_END=2230 /DNA_ORIENTATION=-
MKRSHTSKTKSKPSPHLGARSIQSAVDDDEPTSEPIAYFYDVSKPPTWIEYMFGEPHHIPDEYASHQITIRLVLTLVFQSIVTGSILWLQIAVRYYLIETWSVGPSQFVGILSIVQLPICMKFFYGLLIDSVSLCGYRRKSYLLLFGCVAVVSSFGLIYYHASFMLQIVCLCLRSFAIAFCDVIVSAVTVERCEYKPHSVAVRLQCLNYFCMYVVSAAGLIIAAHIEESQNPQDLVYVYWIYFGITLFIIVAAFLLPEHRPKTVDAKSPLQASQILHASVSQQPTSINALGSQKSKSASSAVKQSLLAMPDFDVDDDNDNARLLASGSSLSRDRRLHHHSHDDNDDDQELEEILQFIENQERLQMPANDDSVMVVQDRPQYTLSQILQLTLRTFCRKIIFYPILFTFVMSCIPRANEAVDYYLMYELGFDSHQISYLQIVSSIAFLLSIAIITVQSRRKNERFSLRSLFGVWTLIAAIVPYFTLLLVFGVHRQFGISDFVFAVVDRLLMRVTTDMLLLGTAVLYARICPPGIEGVFFTLLTSVAHLGEVVSYALSAFFTDIFDVQCSRFFMHRLSEFNGLNLETMAHENGNLVCDFENIWLLIVAVNLTALVPLFWIFWIPNEEEMQYIAHVLSRQSQSAMQTNQQERHDDMIALYFVGKDYLFPCVKNCVCACCIKMADQDDNDDEHTHDAITNERTAELGHNNNNHGYGDMYRGCKGFNDHLTVDEGTQSENEFL